VELLEGHLMADTVHMCLQVPPKFSITFVIGFLKGKSAVRIHRTILDHKRVTGQGVSRSSLIDEFHFARILVEL